MNDEYLKPPGLRWQRNAPVGATHAVALAGLKRVPPIPALPTSKLSIETMRGFILPEFQRIGAQFIASRLEDGVLLHDDIGQGKTLQTVAALQVVARDAVRIILCPAFLKYQWKSEVEKFTGEGKTVEVLHPASKKLSKRLQAEVPSAPKWIVGYYGDAERAVSKVKGKPYVLIIDEAHNIRGYKSARLQAVQSAAQWAAGRIGLTGSALINDGAKLYSLLNLIEPGAWGSFWAWATRYASGKPGEYGFETGALSNVEELRYRLSFMALRRTRQDVWAQLPFDTKYQAIWLEPPNNTGLTGLVGVIKDVKKLPAYLEALSKLKTPAIVDAIKNDVEAGTPSITFSYLRAHVEEISKALPDSLHIHGDTPGTERIAKIDAYRMKCAERGIAPHVIATIDSLGEGANLQWAKVVNFGAFDWSPDRIRQAIGRSARMGQTGSVFVRFFGMKRTADEHFIGLLTGRLQEQFKFDGRKEIDKEDLFDVLAPKVTQEALTALYEKFLKEEQ